MTNLSYYSSLGDYNITAIYNGNQNYTGNYEIHILHVLPDATKPAVTAVQADPNNINQTQFTNITAIVTDNTQLDTVYISVLFPNSSIFNYTMNNFSSILGEVGSNNVKVF